MEFVAFDYGEFIITNIKRRSIKKTYLFQHFENWRKKCSIDLKENLNILFINMLINIHFWWKLQKISLKLIEKVRFRNGIHQNLTYNINVMWTALLLFIILYTCNRNATIFAQVVYHHKMFAIYLSIQT